MDVQWINSVQTLLTDSNFEGIIMNRKFGKTLLLAVLVVGGMFDVSAADKVTLNGWTIEAGKVKSGTSRTEPHTQQVSGNFELKMKADPTQTRRAGACLRADLG